MTFEEWTSLNRGDKIKYKEKGEIWEVDHPTSTSTKKEMMNKYVIVDENGNDEQRMAENCPGGGGNCCADGACIVASISTPIGRGQTRHSNTFSDYQNWTKVV